MNYLYEGKWEEIILEPSGDTLPIGSIAQFGGKTAPTNWLFCNGQAVSRETYAELFSVIGTTYGDGDGSTTFNVPDFIGRVPVGLDKEDTDFDTLGETGGEKTHKLTISEMPEHHHAGIKYSNYNQWLTSETGNNGNTIGLTFNTGGNPLNSVKSNENLQYSTDQRGGSQAHNNMQPYTVTNFIIKAKQSVGLVGAITDNINDTNDNAVPNAKTVKDYTDTKTKRQVATIYLSNDVSKVGAKKIPFNMINSNSENLTLSSNGIKIGKGISKILVSGNVFLSKNASPYLWTHIMVNNTEVSIALDNTSSGFASTSHSPKIVSVQENDIIYLGKIDDDIGTIRGKTNTYLTVEVIE